MGERKKRRDSGVLGKFLASVTVQTGKDLVLPSGGFVLL
jgi:hypothetical protein